MVGQAGPLDQRIGNGSDDQPFWEAVGLDDSVISAYVGRRVRWAVPIAMLAERLVNEEDPQVLQVAEPCRAIVFASDNSTPNLSDLTDQILPRV